MMQESTMTFEQLLSTIWLLLGKRISFYQNYCNLIQKESITNSPSTTTTNERARKTRSVQFSHVQIREHEVILGDHPSTELYPVSLGWGHSDIEETIQIEIFLQNSIIRKEQRRIEFPNKVGRKAYRLKALDRFDRLALVGGFDETELYEMEKERHEEMYSN